MPGPLGRRVPGDFQHVEKYPLKALRTADQPTAVPVAIGINWYCVAAGQRVLTSDLRWLPVEMVDPGAELIGFDEHAGSTSRYRSSEVVANPQIIGDLYEIETDRGSVVVTEDHGFVRCDRSTGRSWTKASDLRPGDHLAYFMDPYEQDHSWEAGWLAGFYDGEGCMASNPEQGVFRVDVSQKVGPELDRVKELLELKGFEFRTQMKRRHDDGGGQGGVLVIPETQQALDVLCLSGKYHTPLRFLGQIRPQRLLPKARQLWEGRSTVSKGCSPVIVQSVRALGRGEAWAIGTTTKTLIVEGLLSHNTNFDRPEKVGVRWWVGRGDLGSVRGGHCVCLKPPVITDNIDWWDYYNQGTEGSCVGFGSSRMMSLLNRKRYDARWLYHNAQLVDEWSDTPPAEGTSVRAACDVLRTQGNVTWRAGVDQPVNAAEGISANRWATSWDEVRQTLGLTDAIDGVPFLNSWGRDYPHICHLTDEAGARLLSEDGEFAIVTDK
jgi:hypothetical protein